MRDSSRQGLIFSIQHFSIHDGPGIRTTVFLKGCPLSCEWCSNPESQLGYPEIITNDAKCIGCGKCVEICKPSAIEFVDNLRRIDRDKCNLCLECAKVCPSGAIEQVGRYMTVEEVVKEVEKDRVFYLNSDGGVTLSGGEPLAQGEFVCQVLKECQEKGIHTTLDTCGYAQWDIWEEAIKYTDLVLYDIKHLDPKKHREGTGVSNELILSNARKVTSRVRTWLRFPIIPGYNDSASHIKELSEFVTQLNAERICLLPYHAWGEQKYQRLGRNYPLRGLLVPTDEDIQNIKRIIEAHDLLCHGLAPNTEHGTRVAVVGV
jgi:pyruvate formate lyase activating enzyme